MNDDLKVFRDRLVRMLKDGMDLNITALRQYSVIEEIKYIQGTIDAYEDLLSRVEHEYKKMNKEALFDEDDEG